MPTLPDEVLLAGSEPVTVAQVVGVLGAVLDRPLAYEPVTVADYVADRLAAGIPEPVARFTADWFAAIADGEFAAPGEIERLLGRPPATVTEFLVRGPVLPR